MDETNTPTPRPYRFGVVTPIRGDLAAWRDQVRRLADCGYGTILLPDVPGWQPAPGPALTLASTFADVRVGTWVYAAALHEPWRTAWEAHSLATLTSGRFELGVGIGRPGIEDLGLPVAAPAERLGRVREIVTRLRDLEGPDEHTPVVMAVRGPRARALAAEIADTAAFAIMPNDRRADLAQVVADFRSTVGRDVELAQHVAVCGDVVAEFMTGPDTDPEALRAEDSLAVLPDDPAAAADEIERRREELGFSYFVVGSEFAERLAPMVDRLAA